jgi:hypothetical protein
LGDAPQSVFGDVPQRIWERLMIASLERLFRRFQETLFVGSSKMLLRAYCEMLFKGTKRPSRYAP